MDDRGNDSVSVTQTISNDDDNIESEYSSDEEKTEVGESQFLGPSLSTPEHLRNFIIQNKIPPPPPFRLC